MTGTAQASPWAAAARKWLVHLGWVLLGLLVLVVAALALVGFLHLVRGTPVSHVRAVGDADGPPEIGSPAFRETIELLTGSDLNPGNSLEILDSGAETHPRLWSDLRSARRLITFQVYFMAPGAVADTLSAVLRDRARSGVRVLLLHDAVGSTLPDAYFDRLREAGVAVSTFRPVAWYNLERAQNRSHVRAAVIDGTVGYTGGLGIGDEWIGDGRREGSWRETNVRVAGPAVRQLQTAFLVAWAEASGTLLTGDLLFAPPPPAGEVLAGVMHTTSSVGSTDGERFLALSIAGARRRLWITNPYFVPDDDLRRHLTAAAARGVDVRVLTASRHTDVPLTRLAGRAGYQELLDAGVRIYEYAPSMIHAKTLVADGVWSTVGTMNFDNRSLALNEEVTLSAEHRATAAELERLFLEDLRYAREIDRERFRRRPLFTRARERAATILSRVL